MIQGRVKIKKRLPVEAVGKAQKAVCVNQVNISKHQHNTRAVDSKRLECGPGTILAGIASSLGFGVGGQSYSSSLASTVVW